MPFYCCVLLFLFSRLVITTSTIKVTNPARNRPHDAYLPGIWWTFLSCSRDSLNFPSATTRRPVKVKSSYYVMARKRDAQDKPKSCLLLTRFHKTLLSFAIYIFVSLFRGLLFWFSSCSRIMVDVTKTVLVLLRCCPVASSSCTLMGVVG